MAELAGIELVCFEIFLRFSLMRFLHVFKLI